MAGEETDRLQISMAEKLILLERAREFRRQPTPSEQRLWQGLRKERRGVRFRRQQVIGPFIVDFFCPAQDLIIEVDGAVHHQQVDRDRERDDRLTSCGYRILRFSVAAVEDDLQAVLARIDAVLATPTSTT